MVENDDVIRAMVMIVSPATEDIRRKRGQACKSKEYEGGAEVHDSRSGGAYYSNP